MRFSKRDKELIAIYNAGSRTGTVDELVEALIYMDGPGERAEAINLVDKLEATSDRDFAAMLREMEGTL